MFFHQNQGLTYAVKEQKKDENTMITKAIYSSVALRWRKPEIQMMAYSIWSVSLIINYYMTVLP